MFEWAGIINGVVKLFNAITAWMHDRYLVQQGRDLQQGEQDAATLETIKQGTNAKVTANSDPLVKSELDDELCIERQTPNN